MTTLTQLTPLDRCKCPHDYYHGDGHYLGCPASTSPQRFPLEWREGGWYMAWGELHDRILMQRKLGIEIEGKDEH